MIIQEGRFDPETNFVDLTGTFNGWGSKVDRLLQTSIHPHPPY